MRKWGLLLIGPILVAGAAVAVAGTRGRAQPEVSVDALPVVARAHEVDVYVDCSKVSSVAYFPDNPCQTFVLLQSQKFSSARALWAAETHHMRLSGWHHSARQVVDYDGVYSGMATLAESWVASAHKACAYVATDQTGVAAEAKALFPYDPYDIPRGVYAFYRRAKAAVRSQTLWVRLRPPNSDRRCIG